MDPTVKKILTAGNQAPSGENCQPWRFVVRGSTIEVHLRPERDQSAYGWGQRASYMACGAALENMLLAARAEEYAAEVQYFPNAADEWHVATLTLSKDLGGEKDPLADAIPERVSNRKPYQSSPLSEQEVRTLQGAVAGGDAKLTLVTDKAQLQELGRIGSTNEEIMLSNNELHAFFFSHVSWTKAEDEKNKIGFYIKTLELPPPAQKMFKLISHWPVMRLLRAVGFHKAVAKQNAQTNASAAAFGGITMASTTPQAFVQAGQTVERIWLAATQQGLAFQPLTGVLFFDLGMRNDLQGFTEAQRARITQAYENACRIFSAHANERLVFMFRVGRADPPSARSVRFPLEEVSEVVS